MRAGILLYNEEKNAIITIQRIKKDRNYWVIPGGTVEQGESTRDAACREIFEELKIKVDKEKLAPFCSIQNRGNKEVYFFYTLKGHPSLTIHGEEKERTSSDNRYDPQWIELNHLMQINLVPKNLKQQLIYYFEKKVILERRK